MLLVSVTSSALTGCGLIQVSSPGLTSAKRGGGASIDGLERQDDLTARYCRLVDERMAPIRKDLATLKAKDPSTATIAGLADLRTRAQDLEQQAQVEFDADYKTQSDIAFKKGLASTPEWGYGTTNNPAQLYRSETTIEVLLAGATAMSKGPLPYAEVPSHGFTARDLQDEYGPGACNSDRRKDLVRQLTAARKAIPVVKALSSVSDEDLPFQAGDWVRVDGEVATAGESPTTRFAAGRPTYKNCRETNRFDHFDANGHARYVEECDRAGGRGVDLTITFRKLGAVLPADVKKVGVGDYVSAYARVVSRSKKVVQKGDVTTTVHTLEVEPLVLTGHKTKGAKNLTYQY